MLELLAKYAADHDLVVEPGFAPKQVRWAICLSKDGAFESVVELGDTQTKKNKGQWFAKCPDLTQPQMTTGGETRSHFLVDTAQVVACFRMNPDDTKIALKHDYFIARLREASAWTPELGIIADFLDNPDNLETVCEALTEHKAKPTDTVTFRVGGVYPLESNAWHGWWRDFWQNLAKLAEAKSSKGRGAPPMCCLVTGDPAPPARTHPKIKGLIDVGGQASGSTLIGFDKGAFTSYGLRQSANAAVSEAAAYAYVAALNSLLAEHAQRLAGAKVVYWFKEAVAPEDDPLPFLVEAETVGELDAQERARRLLNAIREGGRHRVDNRGRQDC